MLIVAIVLIIISILVFGYAFYLSKHTHQYNKEIDEQNQQLIAENNKLRQTSELLTQENCRIKQDSVLVENKIAEQKKRLQDAETAVEITLESQQKTSQAAFENYCKVLENNYKEYEEEYESYMETLKETYQNLQLQLMQDAEAKKDAVKAEMDQIQAELDKIKATRTAAIQAQLKEKEIKEQLSFYCLQIKDVDLKDITVLESIKPKLNNPRILSMLIWQTYWRKPMTDLCNNIIGTSEKTGIYKITNQLTNECYIGQAIDIAERWKQHAKCGLGIDTPVGNKLYKAMQEYGIQNFSFEILEECPKVQLNEKEMYYINLYGSKEYGYNTTAGNKS